MYFNICFREEVVDFTHPFLHAGVFFVFLYFCILTYVFREEAVDFTHPFLHYGLGVLGYKGAAPRSLQQLADDDSVKVPDHI